MKFFNPFRKAYKIVKDKATGADKIINKIAITKYTAMPAILTENGFYTNPKQCIKMLEDETIIRIAEAHIKGIKQYLHLT